MSASALRPADTDASEQEASSFTSVDALQDLGGEWVGAGTQPRRHGPSAYLPPPPPPPVRSQRR